MNKLETAVDMIRELAINRKEDFEKESEKFMAAAATNPIQAIDWSKDIIIAQVTHEQMVKLTKRLQILEDAGELTFETLQELVEEWVVDIERPLMEDWLSHNSTSSISNAINDARRTALARLLRYEVKIVEGSVRFAKES